MSRKSQESTIDLPKSIFVSLIITQPGTFIKSKLINSSVSYLFIVDEFNLNLLEKNYASKLIFFFPNTNKEDPKAGPHFAKSC